MSHVDTDLVTREQLALVETPDATRSFKPVPHRPTFAIRCLNGLPLKEAAIKAAQLVQSGEVSGGNA